jgi:hypothetical protein
VKSTRRRLLSLGAQAVLVLCLHALLKRWMAGGHVAATFLSAGPHTPRLVLAGAGLFIAVRLFTVLLLPGLFLASLGGILYDHRRQERSAKGA